MNLPQMALAQVDTVYASEGKVGVTFPTLAMLSGLRVIIAGDGLSARSGEFRLPQRGDFGLVSFYQDDPRSCTWLWNLSDNNWHSAPLEVFETDPLAQVAYARDGSQTIHHGNGDVEVARPDGTVIRLTHSKDGTMGNATGRAAVTPRMVSEPEGQARTPTRKPYTPPALAPADLVINHASGTTVRLSADGSILARTAKGHRFSLYDATEKARNPEDPLSVTATPDEDANRVTSRIEVISEKGHRITLKDDPVLEDGRQIEIQSAQGHRVLLKDDPVKNLDRKVEVTTAGGHRFTLKDGAPADKKIEAVTAGGLGLLLHDPSKTVTVTGETVVVNADVVRLGSAGASRKVVLDGDSGPDAHGGTVPITSTAVKVFGE